MVYGPYKRTVAMDCRIHSEAQPDLPKEGFGMTSKDLSCYIDISEGVSMLCEPVKSGSCHCRQFSSCAS